MAVLRQILERMGLSLNEAKTQEVKAYQGKFSFLGFEIWMAKSRRTGSWYPHVQPSKKSLKTIKERITQLTVRTRTAMPMDWLVNALNATVRGWVGYFHVCNCSKSLTRVRWHLEERMRTHLRKRHKVRNRRMGYLWFADRDLYGKYGHYKVPTTAGWTKAHALR
jgi:RNA-directed DNA polymerase